MPWRIHDNFGRQEFGIKWAEGYWLINYWLFIHHLKQNLDFCHSWIRLILSNELHNRSHDIAFTSPVHVVKHKWQGSIITERPRDMTNARYNFLPRDAICEDFRWTRDDNSSSSYIPYNYNILQSFGTARLNIVMYPEHNELFRGIYTNILSGLRWHR